MISTPPPLPSQDPKNRAADAPSLKLDGSTNDDSLSTTEETDDAELAKLGYKSECAYSPLDVWLLVLPTLGIAPKIITLTFLMMMLLILGG
jgi:hypothetical protein